MLTGRRRAASVVAVSRAGAVDVVFVSETSKLVILQASDVVDGVIQIPAVATFTVSHVQLVEVV